MNRRTPRAGFSMVELMFSAAITVMVVMGATSALLYMIRGERVNSIQSELDMDVRKSMEWLKHDLRLSSMDKIFFYPEGPGPYSAVSFPMARDDDGDGAIELDADDNIIWDKTVVYHVWDSRPNELRVTTFDRRDNALNDDQRQQQLNAVVLAGHGRNTYNGSNATTRTIFRNLFDWQISGKGTVFDGYSPNRERDLRVYLGSAVLTPGFHNYQFKVVGRNTNSAGYKMGVDSFAVSPCGISREAEDQLPVASQYGAAASAIYMSAGSWDGNHHLYFPATAAGQNFVLRMANDRWEETNFRATGAVADDTVVQFDESLNPRDFVVRMLGWTYGWSAGTQTRDASGGSYLSDSSLCGSAVRVLIRGEQMAEGGWIDFNGATCAVLFRTHPYRKLQIDQAYIAECASTTNLTMDAVPGTAKRLFGSSGSGAFNGTTWGMGDSGWLLPFPIRTDRSYLVTFLVNTNLDVGNPWYCDDAIPGMISSYIIPSSSVPTVATIADPIWSTRTDVIATNRLFAVDSLFLSYNSNAVFTSQIADTQLDDPVYTEFTWNADVPSTFASLGMKLRTGDQPDLSDAPGWSNVAFVAAGAISRPTHRYAQFQAVFKSNSPWYYETPTLKNATLKWTGDTRVAAVGATFTKGSDYGIVEVTVDGKPLVKGIGINLKIYEDVWSFSKGMQRLTSFASAEVEPRNSGL